MEKKKKTYKQFCDLTPSDKNSLVWAKSKLLQHKKWIEKIK